MNSNLDTAAHAVDDNTDLLHLVERIAKLEGALEDEKKSFSRKFGLWGGLVALIISIMAGTLGIMDRVNYVLAEKERNVARAQELAGKLMEIALEGERLLAQGRLAEVDAHGRTRNIDIMRYVQELRSMDAEVFFDLPSGDLMAMAWYTLTLGGQKDAIAYATQAIDNAPDDFVRAEALRYRAIALFTAGAEQDVSAARGDMEAAMALVATNPSATAEGVRMNVLVFWAAYEAMAGDCEAAQDTVSTHIASINVETGYFMRMKERTDGMIADSGGRCKLSWH